MLPARWPPAELQGSKSSNLGILPRWCGADTAQQTFAFARMGRHNGKARKRGLPVGSALIKRKGNTGGGAPGSAEREAAVARHTTELGPDKQSVIEVSDLDDFMALAQLADRDFAVSARACESIAHSTRAAHDPY